MLLAQRAKVDNKEAIEQITADEHAELNEEEQERRRKLHEPSTVDATALGGKTFQQTFTDNHRHDRDKGWVNDPSINIRDLHRGSPCTCTTLYPKHS